MSAGLTPPPTPVPVEVLPIVVAEKRGFVVSAEPASTLLYVVSGCCGEERGALGGGGRLVFVPLPPLDVNPPVLLLLLTPCLAFWICELFVAAELERASDPLLDPLPSLLAPYAAAPPLAASKAAAGPTTSALPVSLISCPDPYPLRPPGESWGFINPLRSAILPSPTSSSLSGCCSSSISTLLLFLFRPRAAAKNLAPAAANPANPPP